MESTKCGQNSLQLNCAAACEWSGCASLWRLADRICIEMDVLRYVSECGPPCWSQQQYTTLEYSRWLTWKWSIRHRHFQFIVDQMNQMQRICALHHVIVPVLLFESALTERALELANIRVDLEMLLQVRLSVEMLHKTHQVTKHGQTVVIPHSLTSFVSMFDFGPYIALHAQFTHCPWDSYQSNIDTAGFIQNTWNLEKMN